MSWMELELKILIPVYLMSNSLSSMLVNKHLPTTHYVAEEPSLHTSEPFIECLLCIRCTHYNLGAFSTDHRPLQKRRWEKSQEEDMSLPAGLLVQSQNRGCQDTGASSHLLRNPSPDFFWGPRGEEAPLQSPTHLRVHTSLH